MSLLPRLAAACAAALVSVVAFAETGVREAVSELRRPEAATYREAFGTCDIREGSEHQRFRVTVGGVGVALRVYLGDGHENLNLVGEIASGTGTRSLLRTTLEGGELPYGVESVRALQERRIEVRDGDGRVVLVGNVPVFEDEGGGDGGGGDGDGEEPREPLVARRAFQRTDFSGEREPRGVVASILREDGSGLRFEFGRLAPEGGHLLYIERNDAMSLVDDLRANREGGAVLEYDTSENGLPFDADSVNGLAGRRVELRDLEGHVILFSEIPAIEDEHDAEPVHHEEEHEDAETGADVTVRIEIDPETGREVLEVEVRDVPREHGDDDEDDAEDGGDGNPQEKRGRRPGRGRGRKVDLRMDDGTGAMDTVAGARVRGGRARIRIRNRSGLPFGVESLQDLAARPYELWTGASRIAGGSLPQF